MQVVVLVLGTSLLSIINGFTGSTGTGSINMFTVKEAKILELNCPQRQQKCFLITLLTSGITVSVSIPTAVELDNLTPISKFEQNHGMDAVHLSIDSGCWPPEDIIIQAKLRMSAPVDAAGNTLLQLNNLGKQYETQCVLHTALLLEALWSKVVLCTC